MNALLIGIALLDISTGEFLVSRGKKELIEQILHNFSDSIQQQDERFLLQSKV